MISYITPVIIASNAQTHIDECLISLSQFSEVILYLNNSTDTTEKIAQNYTNVKIIHGDFIGFGPTKNKAATFASNDWIFSLDSDEVLPEACVNEIKSLKLEKNSAYMLKRSNVFLGKAIKYSGWGKDYLIRLYNQKELKFNENMVHEFVVTKNSTKIIKLQHSFIHYAVDDVNQFLFKVIKYSDLASHNKTTKSFITVVAKSFFAFFKSYILQLGFLDGWRGFVIAVSNFNGKFFRYTKRYINEQKKLL